VILPMALCAGIIGAAPVHAAEANRPDVLTTLFDGSHPIRTPNLEDRRSKKSEAPRWLPRFEGLRSDD
jgi:hypothetical protein